MKIKYSIPYYEIIPYNKNTSSATYFSDLPFNKAYLLGYVEEKENHIHASGLKKRRERENLLTVKHHRKRIIVGRGSRMNHCTSLKIKRKDCFGINENKGINKICVGKPWLVYSLSHFLSSLYFLSFW